MDANDDISATRASRLAEALRYTADGVSSGDGESIFHTMAKHIALGLDVGYALIGQIVPDKHDHVNVLAGYFDGEFQDGFEYDVADTPCEGVIDQAFRCYPHSANTLFPNSQTLKDLGIVSYAGIPLYDREGSSFGLLVVMDTRPFEDVELVEQLMRIFSVRAAVELERLRAKAESRASAEQYEAIFNKSVDGLIVFNLAGEIVTANPAYAHIHGFEVDEISSIRPQDIIPPESVHAYQEFMEKVPKGEKFRVEAVALRKDKSRFMAEVHGVQMQFRGEPHLLAILRDITEAKRAESELRHSEERLRATFEAALDCIITMDGEGVLVDINPAAEECFGYRADEVRGKLLSDVFIPESSRAAHRQGLRRFKEKGKGPFLGRRVEVMAMRADGSEFPAELTVGVTHKGRGENGDDGQGEHGDDLFIGYLRDITERRHAENDRAQLESQLRQAQKMEAIGHLSGGIAHDFNNILTGVTGYIAMAEEWAEDKGDAKLTRYLERANQAGQRARDLIQQMLTFSRGQRGEPRAMSLAALIKETVKLFQPTLPSSMEIRMDLDANAGRVLADPVHVEQILMNLFINARDAMKGTGELNVGLSARECEQCVCASCRQPIAGEYVELHVGDTGPGVPEGIVDRIFEPFFSTKEVGKGSGMGLSTVHGIIHEIGGHILVDSRMGKGTCFRVLFPSLGGGAGAGDTASGEQSTRPGARDSLSGCVLVVDDDEHVSEFMQDRLESWGLDVELHTRPIEAWQAFSAQSQNYDLVITDQTMPKLTGLELAEKILRVRPDVPVIMYTGHSDSVSEEQVAALGIKALLRKPVDIEQLHGLIRGVLG